MFVSFSSLPSGRAKRISPALFSKTYGTTVIEFHDEAEWAGRRYLLEAGYSLFELDGRRVEIPAEAQRRYHCIAIRELNT